MLAACGAPGSDPARAAATDTGDLIIGGARLPDGREVDVTIRGGRIASVSPASRRDARRPAGAIDARGLWLVPAFIDSHTHLALYPVADELAAHGVAGAVDLAAPVSFLDRELPVQVRWSGPMITSPGGYPTQGWGRDGYGIECADVGCALAAVDRLAAAGASVVKLPVIDGDGPPRAVLVAAARAAHERRLPVACHALTDADARLAADVGCDVLAHTPVEPLSPATVQTWADRAVISTLAAFGGGEVAVHNLAALRAAGARVVYGTDLGNTRTAAIQPDEIALLVAAGLDGAAIVDAATRSPAELWGFGDLGAIALGREASLLLVGGDPARDPARLAAPVMVIQRGRVVGGGR